jgi:hypothetical protein
VICCTQTSANAELSWSRTTTPQVRGDEAKELSLICNDIYEE